MLFCCCLLLRQCLLVAERKEKWSTKEKQKQTQRQRQTQQTAENKRAVPFTFLLFLFLFSSSFSFLPRQDLQQTINKTIETRWKANRIQPTSPRRWRLQSHRQDLRQLSAASSLPRLLPLMPSIRVFLRIPPLRFHLPLDRTVDPTTRPSRKMRVCPSFSSPSILSFSFLMTILSAHCHWSLRNWNTHTYHPKEPVNVIQQTKHFKQKASQLSVAAESSSKPSSFLLPFCIFFSDPSSPSSPSSSSSCRFLFMCIFLIKKKKKNACCVIFSRGAWSDRPSRPWLYGQLECRLSLWVFFLSPLFQ